MESAVALREGTEVSGTMCCVLIKGIASGKPLEEGSDAQWETILPRAIATFCR